MNDSYFLKPAITNLYYLEEEEGVIYFYKDKARKNLFCKMSTDHENAPKFDQETISFDIFEYNLVDLDRTITLFKCVINRVMSDLVLRQSSEFLDLKKITQLAFRGYSSSYIFSHLTKLKPVFPVFKFN